MLRVLLEAEIEFIVVGGVAAIAHGSATLTEDFDIVAPLTVENCQRLLQGLGGLHPRFYQSMGKPLGDRTAEQLAQFRNLYFDTDLGRIDILGALPPVGGYADVLHRSVVREVFGRPCRIVGLDDLIEVKRFVGRPKDKQVELELRALRERMHAASDPTKK